MRNLSNTALIQEKRSLLKQLLLKLEEVHIDSPSYRNGENIEDRIQIDQFNYEVNDAKQMLNLAYESLK